jgi:hypothetical protein
VAAAQPSSVLAGPEEGAHGEAPLAVEVAVGGEGEAVLLKQAVHAPLRHLLVVRLLVPRVVQRHEKAAAAEHAALLLPLRLVIAVRLGHAHAHRRAQGSHAFSSLARCCCQQKLVLVELVLPPYRIGVACQGGVL